MKAKILVASLLALSAASAFAADVGVSISVGQPGFYGRLDVGGYPPPPVIYRQPVLVERPVSYVEAAPIYLRVPPGHTRNWGRYCHIYHACNQRVFFVQDRWYNDEYAPRYRERHGGPHYDGRRDYRPPYHDHRPEYRGEGRHDGHYDGHHDDRGHGGEHGHDRR